MQPNFRLLQTLWFLCCSDESEYSDLFIVTVTGVTRDTLKLGSDDKVVDLGIRATFQAKLFSYGHVN